MGDQIQKKMAGSNSNFNDSREPKIQLSFEFMTCNSAKDATGPINCWLICAFY